LGLSPDGGTQYDIHKHHFGGLGPPTVKVADNPRFIPEQLFLALDGELSLLCGNWPALANLLANLFRKIGTAAGWLIMSSTLPGSPGCGSLLYASA